jgi:hypothetical protein
MNFLGYSVVLGLVGRHPIEKVGERWCGSRVPIVGPHVEGTVGFGDAGLAEAPVGFSCVELIGVVYPWILVTN